jgi:putative membrane protein
MPPKEGQKKEKIIVLSIDRDDDLGEKAGVKGPVFGREDVIEAATKMAIADPEESDANAIFQAVKVFDELKRQYSAQVAVLTGDRSVGIKSDKNVADQLVQVLKKFRADYVVFVTDGAEDEHVMPIIQSRVPILSVRRVIVKQSEQLETGYYKIKDFIEESLEEPKIARIVFGLPAIVLILYSLFGIEGWRAILGLMGFYLLIKGFKLESYVMGAVDELRSSLAKRRLAFFLYIVAIGTSFFATYRGWTALEEFASKGIFELSAAFVAGSVFFYFFAGAVAWVGRNINVKKRRLRNVISITLFGFAISTVIYNAAELIINPDIAVFNFILSIVFGFAMMVVALFAELKS